MIHYGINSGIRTAGNNRSEDKMTREHTEMRTGSSDIPEEDNNSVCDSSGPADTRERDSAVADTASYY